MRKILLLLFISVSFFTEAQDVRPPAYWRDIVGFQKMDSIKAPPANPILFIGSSSFTMWKDVNANFPGYNILNRGFGGSKLTDIIRYTYDIILPYQPSQVVIYCGENDLASGAIKAEEAVNRFKTLFGMIRQNLPNTVISYVSMKPSPRREKVLDELKSANKEIKAFLKKQKKAQFINIYDAMLDANGNMRDELYLDDRLHMTAKGYAIWQKIIAPYLVK